MLIHSSECVQYLCKLLKAQEGNAALGWREYVRTLFKIWGTHVGIFWLTAKLASEIWTQPGGHRTVSESCNYALQAHNGALKRWIMCALLNCENTVSIAPKKCLPLLERETGKQNVLIRDDLRRDGPRIVSCDKEQKQSNAFYQKRRWHWSGEIRSPDDQSPGRELSIKHQWDCSQR